MARSGWRGLDPSDFGRIAEEELIKHRNQVAAEALQMVVMGSPVDLGSYRANHRVSVGGPDTGSDPDAGRGRDAEPPRGAFTNVDSYQNGMRLISTLNAPFTVVYIQNNLPYASRIEEGHSDQAGDGVYKIAANSLREKYGR